MQTKEIVLNIAVNLGRMSRWTMESKKSRIEHFIMDTDFYISELESVPK